MTSICFLHCVDKKLAQTQMFGVHYMPVWIYTLAPYIRELSNIKIYMHDLRIQSEHKIPEASIYLISGINQDHTEIMRILQNCRKEFHNSIFILGGPICWSYQQAGKLEMLSDFDYLIVGDGEPVIQNVISSIISKKPLPKVIDWAKKFDLTQYKLMDRELLLQTSHNYYGAVIEVSRGCPFLCEFCDIRIQKDNNKPNNYPAQKIIEEIDFFARQGITQILFACDNFIGDPAWAEEVCDHIIAWKTKTKLHINLYTWLTINIANFPILLEKLKACGFDMFFIGIESFEQNQLLETAKIQNVKTNLVESIQKIQSHGIIVVAGIIFGFDTEPTTVEDSTLDGILKSGLISGEPSLLTALPGTPLYKRMRSTKRLRQGKLGLGGKKYQTNILYLKSKKQLIANFQNFVFRYNKGHFQYLRLKNFLNNLSKEKISTSQAGYIKVSSLYRLVSKDSRSIINLMFRFIRLFASAERFIYILRALVLVFIYKLKGFQTLKYFNFWIFVWSNSVLKFANLNIEDFDIDSVDENFLIEDVLPDDYHSNLSEPIPEHKMKAQRKFTSEALKKFIDLRKTNY